MSEPRADRRRPVEGARRQGTMRSPGGSSTATRNPAFGGDRRPTNSPSAAGGAGYEQLHATGPAASSRPFRANFAPWTATVCALRGFERHARWMLGPRHDDVGRGSRGYGLDRDTELSSLRAIRERGRACRPGSGAPLPAARVRRRRRGTSTSRLRRSCRGPLGVAAAARPSSSSVARSTPPRRGALPRGVP